MQCNVQLWFSHQVQKACNCEQVPTVLSMTTWKNSAASKGLVLLINTPAYSYSFVLSAWYKSLCTKNLWLFTAVYLITEETTEFQVLEDQNLICSLVAWFLTTIILWLQNSLTMGLNINRRAINLSKDFIVKVQNLNETTSDMTPF